MSPDTSNDRIHKAILESNWSEVYAVWSEVYAVFDALRAEVTALSKIPQMSPTRADYNAAWRILMDAELSDKSYRMLRKRHADHRDNVKFTQIAQALAAHRTAERERLVKLLKDRCITVMDGPNLDSTQPAEAHVTEILSNLADELRR